MNYYLIDYENVMAKTILLDLLKKAIKEDVIHIFYTKNSNTITFDSLKLIQKSEAIIQIEEVEDGKQALDMQLSSFLGYLIKGNFNKYDYYIVSADNDYDSVIKYWQKREETLKISAIKYNNDNNNSSLKQVIVNKSSSVNQVELNELLKTLISDKQTMDSLLQIINIKTKNHKADVHNHIVKLFPGRVEKIKEIYKAVKPYL